MRTRLTAALPVGFTTAFPAAILSAVLAVLVLLLDVTDSRSQSPAPDTDGWGAIFVGASYAAYGRAGVGSASIEAGIARAPGDTQGWYLTAEYGIIKNGSRNIPDHLEGRVPAAGPYRNIGWYDLDESFAGFNLGLIAAQYFGAGINVGMTWRSKILIAGSESTRTLFESRRQTNYFGLFGLETRFFFYRGWQLALGYNYRRGVRAGIGIPLDSW